MLASLWTLISDVLAFCGAHPWLVAIACCAYALYWHSSRVDLHQDAMFGIRKVRPLGLHERFMTEITDKFNIIRDTHAVLVSGPFTPPLVRRALELLQLQYPALRWGIHRDARSGALWFHEYQEPHGKIRLQVLTRQDDGHWEREIERVNSAYNQTISCSDLPWELFFLQNERDPRGRHEFILKTSHAIFDGTAFTFFGPLLVRTCARLLLSDKDGVVEAEPAFAPHGSQEDSYKRAMHSSLTLAQRLIPGAVRVLGAHVLGTQPMRLPFDGVAAPAGRRDCLVRARIGRAEVATFLAAAKSRKVTAHALLMGAFVYAMQRALRLPTGFRVGTGSPVRMIKYSALENKREDVIGDWPSFVEQDIKTRATPIADTAAETAVQERRAEQRAKGEAGGSDGSGDSKSSKRGGGRSDGDGGDAGLSDSKLSILASGDDETVSAESFELVSVYAREAHNCLHVDPKTRLPGSAYRAAFDVQGQMALTWNLVAGELVKDMKTCGRLANIVLSNVGDVSWMLPAEERKRCGPLEIHEWYSLEGQCAAGPDLFVLLSTFHGEMFISLTHTAPLLGRLRARRVLDLVAAVVARIR